MSLNDKALYFSHCSKDLQRTKKLHIKGKNYPKLYL